MTDKPLTSPRRTPTINVTQTLIDRAEAKNSDHCMIADAMRAAMPDVKAVSVDLMTIRWTDPKKGQRYIYLTPRGIQLALIRFDQGLHAEPFTFKMGSPVQVVPAGGYQRRADGTKAQPSRKIQGIRSISGGTARPVKLGGQLPGRAELGSVPVTKQTASAKMHMAARERKAVAEAAAAETAKQAIAAPGRRTRGAKAVPAPPPAKATAAETRAATRAAAEKAAADRAAGKPPTDATNITLEQSSRRHVREFGLKQLVK